jgi:preprotein translocase subunit SecG
MFNLLVTVEILVSIIMMIVILMQSSKGGGLAGSFGGSGMGTMFGVRRTADFLTKSTTILASIFIALSLIINLFFLPGKATNLESVIQSGAAPTSAPQAIPPVSQPAAQPQEQGK